VKPIDGTLKKGPDDPFVAALLAQTVLGQFVQVSPDRGGRVVIAHGKPPNPDPCGGAADFTPEW
jgi:hypothetical protein